MGPWTPKHAREGGALIAEMAAARIRAEGCDRIVATMLWTVVNQTVSEHDVRRFATAAGLDPEHAAGRVHARIEGSYEVVSKLIEDERYEEAGTQLAALAAQVGKDDREVVGFRTLCHFLGGS